MGRILTAFSYTGAAQISVLPYVRFVVPSFRERIFNQLMNGSQLLNTMSEEIYLGRQPIVDANRRLHGFELLFRSGPGAGAMVVNDDVATSAVVIRTLSEFGVEAVLDSYPGFINCGESFLMSDTIELLPPDKIVLEILETTAATESIRVRCSQLRAKGYRLALDDYRGASAVSSPLLPMVQIVKVDILGMDASQLRTVTREASAFGATLLAEKVETEQEFDLCRMLGYQLFQGYYFSRPELVKGKRLSPAQLALIKMLALLQSDADVREIEEVFKQHPMLGVSLLRLANSAATGLRAPLNSIGSAILVLGRRQLERWVLLLMLASGGAAGSQPLLLHVAATRGKLMEILATLGSDDSDLADSAFIAGVVSVIDVLLGMPMEQIVASLGLSQDVSDALLYQRGRIGGLLRLAQALEEQGQPADSIFSAVHVQGGSDMLNRAQGQALAWANAVMKAA